MQREAARGVSGADRGRGAGGRMGRRGGAAIGTRAVHKVDASLGITCLRRCFSVEVQVGEGGPEAKHGLGDDLGVVG